MPGWTNFHNKWAEKMDISLSNKDLNFVNRVIDSPDKYQEYLDAVKREAEGAKRKRDTDITVEALTIHDVGRKGKREWEKYAGEFQIRFLRSKGSEFVRVWCLHHVLDRITWFLNLEHATCIKEIPKTKPEKIFKYLENITKPFSELEYVKGFVKSNLRNIVEDCERYHKLKRKSS